jgi:RNA polymerase sigma factor (sigma-70 family)
MKEAQRSLLQHIETLFDAGTIGERTDRQLLQLFADRDRTAAELAFRVLVKRHGPVIFRACQAILRDTHATEDAFQVTFLVLARKAAGLWVHGSLEPWLLSVARRVACCARADVSRRRSHERSAAAIRAPSTEDQTWEDRNAILHEELNRLPEKYRTAVSLCDLGGLTQEQAARYLGWPCGTVRSRLARGRERLRARLTRRGMAPTVVFAGRMPIVDVTPAALLETTVLAGLQLASGQAEIGAASSVIALTEGVLKFMFWSKLKLTAPVALASALLCGTAMIGYRAMGLPQGPEAAGKQQPRTSADLEVKPIGRPAFHSESSELNAIGKARIAVATKLRDAAKQLWQGGQINVTEYLTSQKRYDEVVADVTMVTDADRVRFLERQVRTLKQIEDGTKELFRMGSVTQQELLTTELARLDAEYALAKAKARALGNTN